MGLTCLLIPKLRITGLFGAVGIVIGLALVNATVWDAALFFSVPDSLSLHALTVFAANGLLFWVMVKLLPGIEVEGILPALVAPVVFSVLSLLVGYWGAEIDWAGVLRTVMQELQAFRDTLIKAQPPSSQAAVLR